MFISSTDECSGFLLQFRQAKHILYRTNKVCVLLADTQSPTCSNAFSEKLVP